MAAAPAKRGGICLLLLLAVLAGSAIALPAADLRQTITFNREWKFQLGDVAGAETAAFDDTKWEDANLPHSFSMPYFAANRFYVGYGWYRKHFDVPAAWSGRRVNPGIPNVVTENGSTIADRPGKYAPGWGDLPSTPGADRNKAGSWRLPWRSGEVIWCGFDHGSLAGRRFGAMGLVDLERIVTVRKTRLTFPHPGNWRYEVEISADGAANWKVLVDETHTADSSADRTDLAQGDSVPGRFVRVIVAGAPFEQSAALAELEVLGTQAAP